MAWREVAKAHLADFKPKTSVDEKNVDFAGFDMAAIREQAQQPSRYTGWQSLVIVLMLAVLMLFRQDPAASKLCFGIHKSSAIIWTLNKKKSPKPKKTNSKSNSKTKSKTNSKEKEKEEKAPRAKSKEKEKEKEEKAPRAKSKEKEKEEKAPRAKSKEKEQKGTEKRVWSLIGVSETVTSVARCRHRHAAALLTLRKMNEWHQNLLLFHMHDKTVVRLDPHGRSSGAYETDTLDARLTSQLKKLGWTYMGNPLQSCNRLLLQRLESQEVRHNPDLREGTGGFCGAWSIYLFHMAHTHPHLSNSELVELSSHWLLDAKARNQISTLHEFIKGYIHIMMLFAGDLMNSTWIDLKQSRRTKHPYYPDEYDTKEFIQSKLHFLLSQLA